MSTRGYFGYLYDDKVYCCYNHFDSYFSGLGFNLLMNGNYVADVRAFIQDNDYEVEVFDKEQDFWDLIKDTSYEYLYLLKDGQWYCLDKAMIEPGSLNQVIYNLVHSDSYLVAKIDGFVKEELGQEYDLDMLGCTLQEFLNFDIITGADIMIYLYTVESFEDACQIIKDYFDTFFET